jgi:hypothetical protein
MITKKERLLFALASLSSDEAAQVEAMLSGIRAGGAPALHLSGFESVDVAKDAYLTPDGREIVRIGGEAWALTVYVHETRKASLMERAIAKEAARKNAETQGMDKREGIAATTCPQMCGGKPCGGTLNQSPVCSSCVTGKMGYLYRYTCESCGFDIVTREQLR